MVEKKIFVSFGIDADTVDGWLGSYDGQNSSGNISRGMFAGEIRVPRLLKLFQREELPATWYWPGRSIETFPEQFDGVVAAGHEIGAHGYSHENPVAMTRRQETEILGYCTGLIEKRSGIRPVGYVTPWWEFSPITNGPLTKWGPLYDHSLVHNGHTPCYVRVGDSQTNINHEVESTHGWMKPLVRGEETDLIELPASQYPDDLLLMMFIKSSFMSYGFVSPRDIEQPRADRSDWVVWEMDYIVSPITIHPDISGRPQNQLMLERLITHIRKAEGVKFAYMKDVALDFKQRFLRE